MRSRRQSPKEVFRDKQTNALVTSGVQNAVQSQLIRQVRWLLRRKTSTRASACQQEKATLQSVSTRRYGHSELLRRKSTSSGNVCFAVVVPMNIARLPSDLGNSHPKKIICSAMFPVHASGERQSLLSKTSYSHVSPLRSASRKRIHRLSVTLGLFTNRPRPLDRWARRTLTQPSSWPSSCAQYLCTAPGSKRFHTYFHLSSPLGAKLLSASSLDSHTLSFSQFSLLRLLLVALVTHEVAAPLEPLRQREFLSPSPSPLLQAAHVVWCSKRWSYARKAS